MHTWKNTRRKKKSVFFFPVKLTVLQVGVDPLQQTYRHKKNRGFREFPSPPNPNHFLLMRVSLLSLDVPSQPGKTSNAPASFVIPSPGPDCSLAARHCWEKKGYHAPAATTTHSGSLPRPSKKRKNPEKNKTDKKRQFPQNPYVLFKGTRVSSVRAFWTLSWTCAWVWW